MNRAFNITANSLASAISKIAAGPHSARRRAVEALERITAKCPHCGGEGIFSDVDHYPRTCWRCDGTGEIVTDEPDRDQPLEPDSRADDLWFEEDNDRYHADLEAAAP